MNGDEVRNFHGFIEHPTIEHNTKAIAVSHPRHKLTGVASSSHERIRKPPLFSEKWPSCLEANIRRIFPDFVYQCRGELWKQATWFWCDLSIPSIFMTKECPPNISPEFDFGMSSMSCASPSAFGHYLRISAVCTKHFDDPVEQSQHAFSSFSDNLVLEDMKNNSTCYFPSVAILI